VLGVPGYPKEKKVGWAPVTTRNKKSNTTLLKKGREKTKKDVGKVLLRTL